MALLKKISLITAILLLQGAFAATLVSSIENIADETVLLQDQQLKQYVYDAAVSFYTAAHFFLTKEVVTQPQFAEGLIRLITAFYVLIFAYLGMKYIFKSGSITERNKIKSDAQRAILLAVLIVASSTIFEVVLDMEASMTNLVVGPITPNANDPLMNKDLGTWSSSTSDVQGYVLKENPPLTAFYAFTLAVAGFTLAVRHILVMICAMIFPLLIFFLYIPVSFISKLGEILLKLLALAVFLPFLDSFIILAMNDLLQTITANNTLGLTVLAFGFLMIGVFNVIVPYLVLVFTSSNSMNVLKIIGQYRSQLMGA